MHIPHARRVRDKCRRAESCPAWKTDEGGAGAIRAHARRATSDTFLIASSM
jgi:hypothetical protein